MKNQNQNQTAKYVRFGSYNIFFWFPYDSSVQFGTSKNPAHPCWVFKVQHMHKMNVVEMQR